MSIEYIRVWNIISKNKLINERRLIFFCVHFMYLVFIMNSSDWKPSFRPTIDHIRVARPQQRRERTERERGREREIEKENVQPSDLWYPCDKSAVAAGGSSWMPMIYDDSTQVDCTSLRRHYCADTLRSHSIKDLLNTTDPRNGRLVVCLIDMQTKEERLVAPLMTNRRCCCGCICGCKFMTFSCSFF